MSESLNHSLKTDLFKYTDSIKIETSFMSESLNHSPRTDLFKHTDSIKIETSLYE